MIVDYAFLCDYAEAGQKLHAMGIGIDAILAKQVPVTHPTFFLVIQLRANAAEAGEKNMTIRLIDADGKDVIPEINATLTLNRPPQGATDTIARLALRLNGITFPRFSEYAVHVLMQGQELVQLPIRVAMAPAA